MLRSRAPSIAVACLWMAAVAAQTPPAQPQRHSGVDFTGLAQATRPVSNNYPVSGPAQVFVSNQWGTVRVVPWGEQIIRVTAEIRVGAATTAIAERLAQAVEVSGNHVGDRVEVQTKYPTVDPPTKAGFETNIEINVPAMAAVEVSNTFGDVIVHGLKGALTIDTRFCDVELADLSGPVRTRMKGLESKLDARDLHSGGVFILRSIDATFTGVAGQLNVDNYLGGVTLRPGSLPSKLDVACESGPIHLYLDPGSKPDLVALANAGAVHSDVAVASETWGNTTIARNKNADAPQHIDLLTSFADIDVHQQAPAAPAGQQPGPNGTPVTETKAQDFDLPASGALRLNLMAGNITIEAHDKPKVEVTQNKFVRVLDVGKTKLAVEALAMRAESTAEYLGIATAVQDDMNAIGCTEYRADVVVRVPKNAAITVRAEGGETKLIGLAGSVKLEQESGRVVLQNVAASANVVLKKGEIESTSTTGAIDLTAGGAVTVRKPSGSVHVQSGGGNTLIDTPSGPVSAHSNGGDVRIIALDGIGGDYDIKAEGGNISLAVPDKADALFVVNVYHGTYFSVVPLTGTSDGDTYAGQGRLNAGTHRIVLESRNGNVVID